MFWDLSSHIYYWYSIYYIRYGISETPDVFKSFKDVWLINKHYYFSIQGYVKIALFVSTSLL